MTPSSCHCCPCLTLRRAPACRPRGPGCRAGMGPGALQLLCPRGASPPGRSLPPTLLLKHCPHPGSLSALRTQGPGCRPTHCRDGTSAQKSLSPRLVARSRKEPGPGLEGSNLIGWERGSTGTFWSFPGRTVPSSPAGDTSPCSIRRSGVTLCSQVWEVCPRRLRTTNLPSERAALGDGPPIPTLQMEKPRPAAGSPFLKVTHWEQGSCLPPSSWFEPCRSHGPPASALPWPKGRLQDPGSFSKQRLLLPLRAGRRESKAWGAEGKCLHLQLSEP